MDYDYKPVTIYSFLDVINYSFRLTLLQKRKFNFKYNRLILDDNIIRFQLSNKISTSNFIEISRNIKLLLAIFTIQIKQKNFQKIPRQNQYAVLV